MVTMLFENNNDEKLSLIGPVKEDPEIEELANKIRAENQKTPIPNMLKDSLHAVRKTPEPPVVDDSDDQASKLGKFGWHEAEGTVIPYLMRLPDIKLISKRMAEVKLLKGLENFFSTELLSCMHINLIPATAAEARLLNDINKNHIEESYGVECFKEGDILILLSDLTEMIAFLRYCCVVFAKQLEMKKRPCGFLKISKEIVPYVFVDEKMYLPLFYFDGDIQLLHNKAMEVSGWHAAYLKLLCKVQGVRKEFFEVPSIECVDIHALRRLFGSGTSFQETWPSENKLVYSPSKPPPLNKSDPKPTLKISNPDRSQFKTLIKVPNLPSPVELPRISPLSIDAPKASPDTSTKSPLSVVLPKPSPSSVDVPKITQSATESVKCQPTVTDPIKKLQKQLKSLSAPKTTKNKPKIRPWSGRAPAMEQKALPSSRNISAMIPSLLGKPEKSSLPQISSRITPRTHRPNSPSRTYQPRSFPYEISRMEQPDSRFFFQPPSPLLAASSLPGQIASQHPSYRTMNGSNPSRHSSFEHRGPPNVVVSNRVTFGDNGSNTRWIFPQSYQSHFEDHCNRPPVSRTPAYDNRYDLQRAVLTNDEALVQCIDDLRIDVTGLKVSVDAVACVYFNIPSRTVLEALSYCRVQVYEPSSVQKEILRYRGLQNAHGMIFITDLRRKLDKIKGLLSRC